MREKRRGKKRNAKHGEREREIVKHRSIPDLIILVEFISDKIQPTPPSRRSFRRAERHGFQGQESNAK